MSIRALTFPTKRLSAFLTSTGLVLKINNANHWDGAALSAGELGTVIYATLRNESNTQLEVIELDASTVALLATTGATITKRACGYTGGTTASAETAYNWPANETLVELGTHPPQLFENLVDLDEAQTVDAIKTFTVAARPRMISDVDAVANEEFVTLGQLNRLSVGTTVTNRVVLAGTAGETIAAGQLVYLQLSTQRWRLVDADLPTTSDRTLQLGIAQGAGTTGNGISNGVLVYGEGIALSGLTAGARYYVSGTAGAIVASVPGSVERFVGVAITTTRFFFCPNDLSDNFWIGIAGGSIFTAQVAYQRSSDGKWLSASANAATTSVGMPVGFVEVDATVGQAAIIRKSGTHMGFAGGTPGANYYITNSTGVAGTTPGTFFRHVAVADANGRLMVVDNMNVYGVDQTGQQIYAATATGNDTYVVSMTPTLKAYFVGFTFRMKVDVGNTGAATVNVDGLGAISIVKGLSTTLETGDFVAGQILTLKYDGTNFQITEAPVVLMNGSTITNQHFHSRKAVTATRDLATASGNQTIAHGLGVTPKWVRITCYVGNATMTEWSSATGVYDGSTTAANYLINLNGSPGSGANVSTTNMISVGDESGAGTQTATVTMDATNVTLAWTKVGGATGNARLVVEVGV